MEGWLGLIDTRNISEWGNFLPVGGGREGLAAMATGLASQAHKGTGEGSCEWGVGRLRSLVWWNERGLFQDTCCRVLVSCPI